LVLRLGGQPTHDFLDDLLALVACFIFYALLHPPADLLFPYTTLFRSSRPPASVPPSCVPARSARRPCTTSSAAVPPGGAGGPPCSARAAGPRRHGSRHGSNRFGGRRGAGSRRWISYGWTRDRAHCPTASASARGRSLSRPT